MEVARESLLLVDDHGHAGLAMLGLCAVDPHGRGGINEDSKSRDGRISRLNGHETREDACDAGVQGDRLAWVVEVGLYDRVVLGHELELHHVAFGGDDVVRRVSEGALCVADGNDVDGYLA
jgi:hypothetical protein